jgi:GMP synthase-like glutamine amidotransferase
MRVLIIDLLAERLEFGHGGNIEMIKPFVNFFSEIEVLLVTPQYENFSIHQESQLELNKVGKTDVPYWDEEVEFNTIITETIGDSTIRFIRIFTPLGKIRELSTWFKENGVCGVYCSGSRRNVSQPEPWMENAKNLLKGAIAAEIPLLGICFGHQLLADALGGLVGRALKRTDAVFDLELTNLGLKDPLFDGLVNNNMKPVILYTHQDHVEHIITEQKLKFALLGSSEHCKNAAIRVIDENEELLPAWGVQFHPEASKARINRSYDLGHISLEEKEAFNRDHDGARILDNFASIVHSENKVNSEKG